MTPQQYWLGINKSKSTFKVASEKTLPNLKKANFYLLELY